MNPDIMFKKNSIFIIVFILIIGMLFSCQKPKELSEPIVKLISPLENSQVQVPDTLEICFKIQSDHSIKSVAASIVNGNYISITGTSTINEPETETENKINILIRDQHKLNEAPYYIKVAVNDGTGIWNSYFAIQLANKPLLYKGFYLFSRPGIHQTKIGFYDQDLNDTSLFYINGEYVESSISGMYNKLFIATETRVKLGAHSIGENILEWDIDSQFPNPGFTDIQLDENRIYAGMQSGQIAGYSQLNGQQKFVTELLLDTFPEKICVLEEYIIGDYLARIGGNKTIVTFYKETGVKKHRRPINMKVVSMLNTPEPNAALVIGNEDGKGKIALYNANNNFFEYSHQIDEGPIIGVSELDNNYILLTIDQSMYVYNLKQNMITLLANFQDIPENIYFEQNTNQIIVLFEKNIKFLLYPGLNEIASLEFENTLQGLQLYYQYD